MASQLVVNDELHNPLGLTFYPINAQTVSSPVTSAARQPFAALLARRKSVQEVPLFKKGIPFLSPIPEASASFGKRIRRPKARGAKKTPQLPCPLLRRNSEPLLSTLINTAVPPEGGITKRKKGLDKRKQPGLRFEEGQIVAIEPRVLMVRAPQSPFIQHVFAPSVQDLVALAASAGFESPLGNVGGTPVNDPPRMECDTATFDDLLGQLLAEFDLSSHHTQDPDRQYQDLFAMYIESSFP